MCCCTKKRSTPTKPSSLLWICSNAGKNAQTMHLSKKDPKQSATISLSILRLLHAYQDIPYLRKKYSCKQTLQVSLQQNAREYPASWLLMRQKTTAHRVGQTPGYAPIAVWEDHTSHRGSPPRPRKTLPTDATLASKLSIMISAEIISTSKCGTLVRALLSFSIIRRL